MTKKPHMTRKPLTFLILFITLFTVSAGAFDLDGNLSLTITLKPEKVEFDLSIGVDLERDDLELDTTWKADEKGFSSLKSVVAYPLSADVTAEAQVVFDDTGLKTLKLTLDDLPLALEPDAASKDTIFVEAQATVKAEETLSLYEVAVDLDPVTIGCVSAAVDLTLRRGYARCTLDLEHDPWEVRLRDTWKSSVLDEREARLSYDVEGFELEETFDLAGFPAALHPVEGTLSLHCDIADDLTASLDCDHTFGPAGITVDRLTASVSLDPDPFSLSWKGRFEPGASNFALSDVDLALSAKTDLEPLSVTPKLKFDETGFRSLSIKLTWCFSAG